MSNHNSPWAPAPMEQEEQAVQIRPMSLKVHYTFDRDSQVNCLARWPHILQLQAIQLDDRNAIGVVDLKTCLQAVAQCSPELAGDSERDFTVYAFDYSEPDTPLVGQGLLSWSLEQNTDGMPPQLVTGRVTKNLLAIFGNGVKETLEVKLKLTAVPKVTRATPAPSIMPMPAPVPNAFPSSLHRSGSMMSESTEWNTFVHSHPNLGHAGNVAMPSPVSGPVHPFNSAYDARNEVMGPIFQSGQVNQGSRPGSRVGSRPGSVEPNSFNNTTGPAPLVRPSSGPQPQVQAQDPTPAPVMNMGGRTQSRPSSRASSRAPTGRPRGRPRKKPIQVDGSTSGYEDGTDADDPPPAKKRAKTTKVERSNTATFGSAPESLRVAASTAGSLRNFRPIASGGDPGSANHLQEVPRAPTPVPDHRLPGLPRSQPAPPSQLRRQSSSNLAEQNASFTNSYLDVNRSTSLGLDARSPNDSMAPSPSQYSEEASPADIGSSPPVPRSVRYSARSSPAPSSPILPPMPAPQVDSGFMSGGFEDSRIDEDDLSKPEIHQPPAPIVAKPKPKRSRAKKQQPQKTEQAGNEKVGQVAVTQPDQLIIHNETPGPPELLPVTSIYAPPNGQPPKLREQAGKRNTPALSDKGSPATLPEPQESTESPMFQTEPCATMSPENEQPQDYNDLEQALLRSLSQKDQIFDGLIMGSQGSQHVSALEGDREQSGDIMSTVEQAEGSMEPPPLPAGCEETVPEPELPPMVPTSDPVFPQASIPDSEPAHPQTDAACLLDGKYNKNYVKKQSIKQKLEEALAAGQMPQFCTNCGAIQTPTWRKIFKQEHKGMPSFHEFSDKPGHVTAINILTRDEDGTILSYELIKKALGQKEDRTGWTEVLLCNPCGLWFAKWKTPRPADKWEKDQERLNQTRKRRDAGDKVTRAPRPKKPRTKSGSQNNPTSEAGPMTDAPGFEGTVSPKNELCDPFLCAVPEGNGQNGGPGSTHSRASNGSRGSGRTPGSPIAVDEEFGHTRRLLFPSPRKDGEQKILGEVAVNIVHTALDFRGSKQGEGEAEKENNSLRIQAHEGDMADLFGTPARPSTPPPKPASGGSFKTPSRPTPSHRPVTRSVTKSMRSVKSPSQALSALQRTPSRTPRSKALATGICRRSPRVAGLPSHVLDEGTFESPFTRSLNQLLSEANGFVTPELDFGNLPHLDAEGNAPVAAQWDFGNILSTDGIMPSSPPVLRHSHPHVSFDNQLSIEGDADLWAQLNAVGTETGGENYEASEN